MPEGWQLPSSVPADPGATLGLVPRAFLGYVWGWISPSWCHRGAHALCFSGIYLGLDLSVPLPPWCLCLVFTRDQFWAGFLHPSVPVGLVPCL